MSDVVTERDGYIFVRSTGRYTLGVFQKSLGQTIALAREKGISNVLVDAREQTELPGTLDTFLGAEELAAKTVGLRIAVVMTTDHLPQHSFFELASRNRGALIRTFPDEDSALEWLFDEGATP
jgi:hypothetical protein